MSISSKFFCSCFAFDHNWSFGKNLNDFSVRNGIERRMNQPQSKWRKRERLLVYIMCYIISVGGNLLNTQHLIRLQAQSCSRFHRSRLCETLTTRDGPYFFSCCFFLFTSPVNILFALVVIIVGFVAFCSVIVVVVVLIFVRSLKIIN